MRPALLPKPASQRGGDRTPRTRGPLARGPWSGGRGRRARDKCHRNRHSPWLRSRPMLPPWVSVLRPGYPRKILTDGVAERPHLPPRWKRNAIEPKFERRRLGVQPLDEHLCQHVEIASAKRDVLTHAECQMIAFRTAAA